VQTAAISPERIGEAVDHLVTAPISNWTILKGLPLLRLHAAARARAGGPVTLDAAKVVHGKVGRGGRVFGVSGFVMRV
jgi:hypothetical protein